LFVNFSQKLAQQHQYQHIFVCNQRYFYTLNFSTTGITTFKSSNLYHKLSLLKLPNSFEPGIRPNKTNSLKHILEKPKFRKFPRPRLLITQRRFNRYLKPCFHCFLNSENFCHKKLFCLFKK
jgi:hypothetical protein